ncbi:AAA family ATPase [Hoeflea ulvae]|uniref:AAA family ATPase n=1 Tax=Hoeflea ulvae TaxID=2983764 RepID=A0ABT3YBD4_9HYPH|nr:AAA family ATPase [Hoeflea ulvae]MCY0093189.1 AAA family ATPase [Hoeflea ulvae]
MPKFVITGASGGGKSTLISALAAKGYATVPEVGRRIVAEQVATHGTALPWLDQAAFMDLLFARSIEAFDEAGDAAGEIVFFDRSFYEALAYGAVIGRPVPQTMAAAAAARRFDTPVFVCPPWQDIFTTDDERRHGFDFALRDHAANVAIYQAAGYTLVELPRVPVAERVGLIAERLCDLSGPQPSNPSEKR